MKKLTVLIAVLFPLFSINGQTDGLLWKINGKGLKKPSYLFGTIHYHCQPESINKPAVMNAIKATSKVALELNLGDMDVLMAMYQNSLKPSGLSLQSVLSPADYKKVDSTCRYYMEDSLANFDTKSPMDLMSQFIISEKFMGCKGLPVDFTIAQMAKNGNKKTMGLENFEFQDSLLKSIPLGLQNKWLLEFCSNPEKVKAEFDTLTNAYNAHKGQELYKISLESSPEFNYLNDALLVQRNISWVNFLKSDMKLYPVFVAVGAAHLGGETGLIELLRKAGYTLTPIKF